MTISNYFLTLSERLANIKCSPELKLEILKYIENGKFHKNPRTRISNWGYNSNLYYIEENISKEGLIDEIKEMNARYN